MEQNKNVDKELVPLKKELQRIFRDHRCLQTDNPSPGANSWITPVTPDVAIAQMKAGYDAWKEQLDKINADRYKDIWDAVRKILMEHIDDPFTCDPSTEPKEEFERRHINAVVFAEIHDYENLRFTTVLMGIVQGDTLIASNGARFENFKWKADKLMPGMLTYEDNQHPNIRMESIGEMTLNPEKMERLWESLYSVNLFFDKEND
ncbi:MAG: hypothetical protein IKH15_12065 [Bacteroidales bacterium]|nr:hypothetical protein [Bacteroidales bacterium]